MKRTVLLLLGALVMAGGVFADDTPTPTITPTNTVNLSLTPTPTFTPTNTFNLSDTKTCTLSPSPTISPTYSATPTLTFTLTKTQVPQPINQRFKRVYISPRNLRLGDSISRPVATPAAGVVYLAKSNNIASAVFAVPTPGTEPQVRVRWTVPQDFLGWPYPLRLWMRGVATTASADNTFCVNTYRMWNNSSSTVVTSTAQNNYVHIQSMLGVTTNVQTQLSSYSLSQLTVTSKRVLLTMPVAITQCGRGDELEFEIIRAAGTGVVVIQGLEIEYDKKESLNP